MGLCLKDFENLIVYEQLITLLVCTHECEFACDLVRFHFYYDVQWEVDFSNIYGIIIGINFDKVNFVDFFQGKSNVWKIEQSETLFSIVQELNKLCPCVIDLLYFESFSGRIWTGSYGYWSNHLGMHLH